LNLLYPSLGGIIFAMNMKKGFRLFLSLFLLSSLIAIGVSLVISYHNRREATEVKAFAPTEANVSLDRMHYIENRDGQRDWELEATSARYFKDENLTILDRVKVVFYSKKGITYTLEGREGRFKNDTRDVEVRGDVVITSSDGYQLKTDSLKMVSGGKEISTEDRVVLKGPRLDAKGVGLLIDREAERLTVLRNVKAILKEEII